MTLYLAIRDGGKTNEEGALRFLKIMLKTLGVAELGHLEVTERGAGANKSVDVATGDIAIEYNDYIYHGWNSATYNIAISDNTSGNDRKDVIVAFVDLAVVDNSSSNNPGAFAIEVVEGTPAGSPVVPDDTAIQTAIGSGNPYVILAEIDVADSYTSITNSEILDTRTFAGVRIPVEEVYTDTDGTTVTFDIEAAKKHIVTLAGNRTLALSNVADGDVFVVLLKQDGTGSRTVTWWSGIKWPDGVAPTLSTSANKVDMFGFIRLSSTEYYGTPLGQNMS